MSHYCPSCEKDISSLISWENLTEQYNSGRMLFCPYCSVGLQLNYDEEWDGVEEYSYWSFEIAKRGD
jgi:transcription elongation factor Elf1